MDNPRLVEIYNQARKDFEDFVGEVPEDYKVLVFIDPELHSSLYQIMELGGSPHAVLSQEMIESLRKARSRDFLPDECITIFPSKPTMIYMSLPFELEENPERDFTLRVMFIHAFAHAYFADKSASNDSEIRTEIYRMDMIIKELIMNNAYGLKEDKQITWGLPYFQDMVAVIRLLSTFGVQEFYIPPESSRKVTLFQNFMLEISVKVPEDSTGDIMGDLNSRRGRVLGMDSEDDKQIINALVPMAEILRYAPDLSSMTGGRGTFTLEFEQYDEVPGDMSAKIIERVNSEKE